MSPLSCQAVPLSLTQVGPVLWLRGFRQGVLQDGRGHAPRFSCLLEQMTPGEVGYRGCELGQCAQVERDWQGARAAPRPADEERRSAPCEFLNHLSAWPLKAKGSDIQCSGFRAPAGLRRYLPAIHSADEQAARLQRRGNFPSVPRVLERVTLPGLSWDPLGVVTSRWQQGLVFSYPQHGQSKEGLGPS